MSHENRIRFLYFNENLPHNILEISADLLDTLIATRQSLLNSKQYVNVIALNR